MNEKTDDKDPTTSPEALAYVAYRAALRKFKAATDAAKAAEQELNQRANEMNALALKDA